MTIPEYSKDNVDILILAGGRGSRLKEAAIAPRLPKPLISIYDQYGELKPLLKLCIDGARSQGFNNHYILAGEDAQNGGEMIHEYVKRIYDFPPQIILERKPLGTGGAIFYATFFTKNSIALIMACDTTFPYQHLSSLYEKHTATNADVTIAVTSSLTEYESGNVFVDKTDHILNPNSIGQIQGNIQTSQRVSNVGVLCLNVESYRRYYQSVITSRLNGKQIDFSRDVLPKLMNAGGSVFAYDVKTQVYDLGESERLIKYGWHGNILPQKILIEALYTH